MTSDYILALEWAALEEWNKGNPSGYLDIFADDIVYFDPATQLRLDGIKAMRDYFEPIRGLVNVTSNEIINPKVHLVADMAVLTFNLKSFSGDKVTKWNSTEVYRREPDGKWKIIHSHWSYIGHGSF